jgi:hypothetical protein
MPSPTFSRNTAAAAAAVLTCGAAAAHGTGSSLSVQFSQCTEFVGVAPIDAARARAEVPQRYTPFEDALGARLVVRAADCAAVRVGAGPARPGRVAQIGVSIASPDGTAVDPNTSINNYTVTYASNSAALVAALRAAGVPAALDLGLAYEITPPTGAGSRFYVAVSPEWDGGSGERATWFLSGSVNTPGVPTSFLANWWRLGGGRETKMATSIASISFDFASQVSLATSRLNSVGRLLQDNGVAGFPLSFRGAFDAGTMVVTVNR